MKKAILTGLTCISVISFSSNLSANTNCVHQSDELKCVEYKSNYDANTINFYIPNLHPLFAEKFKLNLDNIEVANPRSKTKCEKEIGKKAKEYVKSTLKNAKVINLTNLTKKRGKIYGKVNYDGQDLGEELISKDLAQTFTKEKINWCK